jgi:hypothetical protein
MPTATEGAAAPIPVKTIVATPAPAAPKWSEISVPLKHPLIAGDQTITAVTLREPDLEALEKIDDLGLAEDGKPNMRQTRGLIEALSGLDGEIVKKLNRNDVLAIVEAMSPLLS